ncbi:energy transducer TonB family protein [Teichococcus aerofrigidensis]
MRRGLIALSLLILAGCAASGPLTPAQRAELATWHGAVVRKLNEKRYYPRDPDRNPMLVPEGRVLVKFSVHRDGRLYTPRVVEGSGSPLLDAAALTTVLNTSPLPPPPGFALEGGDHLSLQVPIVYRTPRFGG